MRLLFYVQHLLGIGHVRRAALLTEALATHGFDVHVVAGGRPVPGIGFASATALQQLPALQAGDDGFKTLVDAQGRTATAALWAERRARLLEAFAASRPDVLLIESYPFGRRAFRSELDPLLETARARPNRPLVACSVRDVLVDKDNPARLEETVDKVHRFFDLVLVHGDPALIPFDRTFPLAARLGGRLRYTGYVTQQLPAEPASPRAAEHCPGAGEVMVSAGGGAVGGPLLRTALAARARSPLADAPWRFLCGPDLPAAERTALAAQAPPGVVVEPARPDFPALLARCRLSISQAGYNTVMDLLQARCRAVVVPFAAGRETEQSLRARVLAERGLLTVVPEQGLSPEALVAGMTEALAQPLSQTRPTLDIDGGAGTAAVLVAAAAGKPLS